MGLERFRQSSLSLEVSFSAGEEEEQATEKGRVKEEEQHAAAMAERGRGIESRPRTLSSTPKAATCGYK